MTLIQLKSKGKKKLRGLPKEIEVPSTDPVSSLIAKVSNLTGIAVHRVRLSLPSDKPEPGTKKKRDTVLVTTDAVAQYATKGAPVVVNVKDLGPQVGWRLVYFLEYLGPLVIHPAFYLLQRQIYGVEFEHSLDQQLVFVLTMLHFAKREYETLFVHKFSVDTMPLFNLFKNCSHYWLLSGFNIAFFGYAPGTYFRPAANIVQRLLFSRLQVFPVNETILYVLAAVWLFGEMSNLYTHIVLSKLRSGNSKERKVPYGYGFSLVSFPNYFFEFVAITSVALISQNWAPAVFAFVGTAQMYIWALKKHRRYRKDFPNYPKSRKAMFPFIA